MEKRSTIHSTFVIERSYPAAAERVFDAFADPTKKRRWFVESGKNDIEQYDLDFRVGGAERARFRFKDGSPLKGIACTNDVLYLDIVPDRRIVFASTMTLGEKRISASLATIEALAVGNRHRPHPHTSRRILRGRRWSRNAASGVGQATRGVGPGATALAGERGRKARTMRRKKPAVDRVFHALGDPTRRAILEKLSEGPISVSRLAEPLGITLERLFNTCRCWRKADWYKPKRPEGFERAASNPRGFR